MNILENNNLIDIIVPMCKTEPPNVTKVKFAIVIHLIMMS